MVITTTSNRVKAGLLASMLALSVVTLAPSVALAAPQNTTSEHANNGKHLGQLKNETVTTDQTSSQSTQAETHASMQSAVKTEEKATTTNTVTSVNAAQKQADPLGNNGTVKIDRTPFDNYPNNEPHVTCSFQVDFYGYDKGVGDAKVTFDLHSPTLKGRTLTVASGDLTPNIGEDAAGGGTDLDASETYTLAFTGAPHATQGYHVKLTVNAPGSQGADVKHKVFWVEPCATPETPVTPGHGGGQILGEAAATTYTKTPAVLPSTGASLISTLATIALMAAAYVATYRSMIRRQAE